MLGRSRRLIEDISLAADLFAGMLILIGLYYVLKFFGPEWEAFLQTVLGYQVEFQGVTHLSAQAWLFLVILFNTFLAFRITGFYELDLFARAGRVVVEALKGVVIGVGITAIILYIFQIESVNRSLLIGFAVMFFLYLGGKEVLLRRYLLKEHYVKNPLAAILIGPADRIEKQLSQMDERSRRNVRAKGIALTDGSVDEIPEAYRHLFVGYWKDLGPVLAKGCYDLVFLGVSRGRLETAQDVLDQAEEQGIEVWYFADFLEPVLARPVLDEYGGKPIIIFKTTTPRLGAVWAKRVFDLVVSSVALFFLAPVFLAVSILIKRDSRGPVFFVQERTGLRGKTFRMFKFRTMVKDAPKLQQEILEQNEMSGPVFKIEHDPRITKVGRVLRKFSIDEFPQLINVFKGEMSLVGPRPLPVYETEQFSAFRDRRRLSVRPGVTGLWQVSGRSEIEDFAEWVRLDLEYIDRWSLWLDMQIIFRTIPAVLKGSGAH